jgi:uroporphyrinogen decarboxylase
MALRHEEPDRVPVDFLATPEVWNRLVRRLNPDRTSVGPSEFFDPAWEAVLRQLQIDCRVVSYDMFCRPPENVLRPGSSIDWWGALSRSTPNRMWRQVHADGTASDILGHHIRVAQNPSGAYEEFASWPLRDAASVEELKSYSWPEPDWWDWSPLPTALKQLDPREEYHIRLRIGSVFEFAWQLRGMQEFLMDLGTTPDVPVYIMERLTDVHVENLKRALDRGGDRIDMVYFYDDVATQNSLMISKAMWRKYIRPCHLRITEVARSHNKPVMYHCDGAIYSLIPELIDIGISVLSPIQPDAKGMALPNLKAEFGDKLTFHGGIDIIKTLPHGTRQQVITEARDRVDLLGRQGGYILCSSHHIQADTPADNVLALYEPERRYRSVPGGGR